LNQVLAIDRRLPAWTRGGSALFTWLCQICRNHLDECAQDSSRQAVRHALNQLAPHHASILELRFGDELTVPQIARLLQLSESAAESRLARARHAFRALWSDASAAVSL
jgi:DNA-directed RNA polymerase specialized sigma24 family protein